MKILAISDTESKLLWDHFDKKYLNGIDLILACGDLDPEYLSFLATFSPGPVLYVHGNHDGRYEKTPPEGCICIEDKIYVHKGVRILGLGGSMRYKPGPHQYTESQMFMRSLKLWPALKLKGGFDILLTHAPAKGQGDLKTLPHQGFGTFVTLMNQYRPAFHVHGHVHMNYAPLAMDRTRTYRDTTIINAYERYIFNYPDK